MNRYNFKTIESKWQEKWFKEKFFKTKIDKSKKIRVIYVSEISPYKHQINVAKAISYLNLGGLDLELRLFGGGKGKYFKKFQNERNRYR